MDNMGEYIEGLKLRDLTNYIQKNENENKKLVLRNLITANTDDIYNLLNKAIHNRNDSSYTKNFNSTTNDAIDGFEKTVNNISQGKNNENVELKENLTYNLRFLLDTINDTLNQLNDSNNSKEQKFITELGLLDKKQRIENMIQNLNNNHESRGGFQKYKKSKKSRKSKKLKNQENQKKLKNKG
jgi:hypothetical protein